jgi:hypothetical protein
MFLTRLHGRLERLAAGAYPGREAVARNEALRVPMARLDIQD